jgi:antitoxin CcdA
MAQIREDRRRRWIEENREAIEASNDYVRMHRPPLAKYRVF